MIKAVSKWIGILMCIQATNALADGQSHSIYEYLKYDPIPVKAEVLSEDRRTSYTREYLRFEGFDGEKVTAYLARPKGIAKPKTVVVLHGLTQSKSQWWLESGPWSFPGEITKALLENGYALFAIDARNHGERIQPWDLQNPYTYITENRVEGFSKMVLNSAIDTQMGIDYLETRPDLTLTDLTVMGFSMGGCIAWATTAAENRVKNLVAMATPNTLPKGSEKTALFSPLHFAKKLKDQSVLMVMANQDNFYNKDDAQTLFDEVGATDKDIVFLDSGHDLPRDTVNSVLPWFLNAVASFK